MKVERSTVTKLLISAVHQLDPITVILEDIEPRRGKIIIECYGKSWSASWGGMGEQTIAQFFCSVDEHYVAKNLSDAKANIVDCESIKNGARRQIITLRRGQLIPRASQPGQFFRFGRAEISTKAARDLWEDIEFAGFGDDGWGDPILMQKVFGDEWWYQLPTKPNPDYEYLCRIIKVVQEVLKSERIAMVA